jgi:hypothetical protein
MYDYSIRIEKERAGKSEQSILNMVIFVEILQK